MASFFHVLFKTKTRTVFVIFLGVAIYTLFWFSFFSAQKDVFQKKTIIPVTQYVRNQIQKQVEEKKEQMQTVLGTTTALPQKYSLSVTPRKQVFNLSCEFAAASAIIHHYTNDPLFAPYNELEAEKTLLAKIPPSQNPNIGVRMGSDTPQDEITLYNNLNKRFGGADYYGVHAAPFIDVFADYGLLAKPLDKHGDIPLQIQKALFAGHVVMAWINVGYGEPVDIALSYGSARVIKGEHAVVLHGYDTNGVFAMDPASGTTRYLTYSTLIKASQLFALPFLEVYPSTSAGEYTPTAKIDSITGLDRSRIKIVVENGSGEVGAANGMVSILQEFGYSVIAMKPAGNFEYEQVTIRFKKEINDYVPLLKKDLQLAFYTVASISADLEQTKPEDMVIIVGK